MSDVATDNVIDNMFDDDLSQAVVRANVKNTVALTTGSQQRVSGGSLVGQTADRLREAIFNGTYPPGSNLRELRIAKELGISQSTVRESLQRLEAAGLVTRQPNVGTTVTRLSPREVRERVELRVLLEVRAAQEASKQMQEPQFAELECLLAALSAATKRDSYYEAAQADLDFHRYVWACSGNETLAKMLDQVTVPLMAFVSVMRALGLEQLSEITHGHEPLVAALRSGDLSLIEETFSHGATDSYDAFMDKTPSALRAQAFGIMRSSKQGRLDADPAKP